MAGFAKRKTKAEFRFRVTSTHSWYRGYRRKTGSLAVRNVGLGRSARQTG